MIRKIAFSTVGLILLSSFVPLSASADDTATPNVQCAPPQHYTYTIPASEFLQCTPTMTDILNVTLPETAGNALARAVLTYRNNNSSAEYYWSTQVVVGNGSISAAQGDDVCPNTDATYASLGYGTLTPGSHKVQILSTQGSNPCSNGQIGVFSGGTLDVWVEDSDPACQGKDIGMISSYNVYGLQTLWPWSTNMQQILNLSVPAATNGRSGMWVFASVEGTPTNNPDKICGSESAIQVAQIQSDQSRDLDTQSAPVIASQGEGHLVLTPTAYVTSAVNTTQHLSLWLGTNYVGGNTSTGGCCGDAKIGFVRVGSVDVFPWGPWGPGLQGNPDPIAGQDITFGASVASPTSDIGSVFPNVFIIDINTRAAAVHVFNAGPTLPTYDTSTKDYYQVLEADIGPLSAGKHTIEFCVNDNGNGPGYVLTESNVSNDCTAAMPFTVVAQSLNITPYLSLVFTPSAYLANVLSAIGPIFAKIAALIERIK